MPCEFGNHFLDELALAGDLYGGQEEDIGEIIAFARRIDAKTRPERRALFDNVTRADAALLQHLADNVEEIWLDAQLQQSMLTANDNWPDEIGWPFPFTKEDIANAAIIIRQRARD